MANPNIHFYRDIWVRLKLKGRAVVECSPALLPRIRKAVQKEKHKDHKWRLANDAEVFRLKTSYDLAKQHATFVLKAKFGVVDRRAG